MNAMLEQIKHAAFQDELSKLKMAHQQGKEYRKSYKGIADELAAARKSGNVQNIINALNKGVETMKKEPSLFQRLSKLK